MGDQNGDGVGYWRPPFTEDGRALRPGDGFGSDGINGDTGLPPERLYTRSFDGRGDGARYVWDVGKGFGDLT